MKRNIVMKPGAFSKRIINKLSGNQHLLAATVLLIILAIFYRDVVFLGRTFLIETAAPGTMPYPPGGPYKYKGTAPGFVAIDPGAIAWQTEPFTRFISKALKRGDFPLWNPYAGLAGSPLLADGYTGPLEPLQLIFFFFPTRFWPYVVDLQLLTRFFITGFSCYLFSRRLKLDFWGSVSSGVLFVLSGYFVFYGNHPQIKTEALLPLVLYGYDRLTDSHDKRVIWISALIIGWGIISAMPEATFFSLFLGTLWYFYKSFFSIENDQRGIIRIRSALFKYTISTILGFCISAAYLLPFFEYLLVSHHVHSPSALRFAFPIWDLPILVFQVQNSETRIKGFFALFSLVIAFLSLKAETQHRKEIIFFGAYAMILSLVMFDFPLTNWIRHLPIFNQLGTVRYPNPSVVFCLAVLAGIFIDRIKDRLLSNKKISLSLLLIFTIFIVLPTLSDPYRSLYPYFADSTIERNVAFGLILGISIALYLLAFLRGRLKKYQFIQMGFLLLIVVEPFYWGIRINRPDRVDPFRSPPFVDFLRDNKEPFRIFGMDRILYPNISTAYGISDIRWLNALVPRRAYEFSTRFIAPENKAEPMRMTGTDLPISDRMFDLLNVKYILIENSHIDDNHECRESILDEQYGDNQPYFGTDTLSEQIFQQNANNQNLYADVLNINGYSATAIFAHPPQEFYLELFIPQTSSSLDFSIGLNPQVFQPDQGDGVTFKIMVSDANGQVPVFSRYIDPKQIPCDRKWFEESINLEKWAGKNILFTFVTEGGPVGDTSWDWAYWGNIQLKSPSENERAANETTSTPKYRLVYQDIDVQIYQNENVLPRAFVVYNVANVSNFNDSLAQLASPSIDLKQTAVVENLPDELANSINKNGQQMQADAGGAKLISSGELDVEVTMHAAGLLVVSEQYYPGWKASIDGKPAPIYAVDGIFRGVFLEKGSHLVKFTYRPASFIIGAFISIGALFISFVFIILDRKLSGGRNE